MVYFGKPYFIPSLLHIAMIKLWSLDGLQFFFIVYLVNNSGTERFFWFFLCFVFFFVCFYVLSVVVRRQCWATCPTVLTMGVSRLL